VTLNLSSITRYVEKNLMIDACEIHRFGDQSQTNATRWDEATGTYTNDRTPQSLVYRGKCMIYRKGANASPNVQGQVATNESIIYVSLPLDAPLILPEDELVVTSSADATLLEMVLYVSSVDQGTFRATTDIELKARVPRVS